MRATVRPGGRVAGVASVPGDKSIAHRLLILAATAEGRSMLREVPRSLDVEATARVLASIAPAAAPGLHSWLARPQVEDPAGGNRSFDPRSEARVEGTGRRGLSAAPSSLDCADSGTTMRLVAGVLAGAPFPATLTGDESLRRRPMDRVAEPLRAMGAEITTRGGRPPIEIRGGPLLGIDWTTPVPSVLWSRKRTI